MPNCFKQTRCFQIGRLEEHLVSTITCIPVTENRIHTLCLDISPDKLKAIFQLFSTLGLNKKSVNYNYNSVFCYCHLKIIQYY